MWLYNELERQVEAILDSINNIKSNEDIENLLNYATNLEIEKTEQKITNFNILFGSGGPQIYFIYEGGVGKLVGRWGSQGVVLYPNQKKVEKILEYLNEVY